MEDNFKKFGKWTAPTGLPLIGGAAYSAGKIMVGFSFSIMSLFCSFFGLPVEAKNFCDKQANAIWNDPFDGLKYGFDSTVQFSREVLHQVFPNVKVDLLASATQAPKAKAAVQQTKEDPKQEANPEKSKDDSGQGVGDKSSMQVDNPRDNPGGFINEDSGHGRGE